MPTKNEVNDMVKTYGLFRNDYILVADVKPLPGEGEKGKIVRAEAWYRCGDCDSFDFSHHTNAVPEEIVKNSMDLKNQNYLSIVCAGGAGKSVGVIRYALTA